MWADPADGFSGFQLAFGAASGTQRAKVQTELASVALDKKENRPLLGWLLLIPVLTGLGWAALSIPKVPGIALAIPSAGLFAIYLVMRWKIADAYMDRLIAQLQLSVGWWGTLYGMLGLAAVCAIFLAPRLRPMERASSGSFLAPKSKIMTRTIQNHSEPWGKPSAIGRGINISQS